MEFLILIICHELTGARLHVYLQYEGYSKSNWLSWCDMDIFILFNLNFEHDLIRVSHFYMYNHTYQSYIFDMARSHY